LEKYVTFNSNVCPECGSSVFVQQSNHYIIEYKLLPDGTIDEKSRKVVKLFDDDSSLELICRNPNCGFIKFGYYAIDDSNKFEYMLDD